MFKSFDCRCCIAAYPHSSPHPPKKTSWLYRNLSPREKKATVLYNRCFSLNQIIHGKPVGIKINHNVMYTPMLHIPAFNCTR